MKYSVLLCVVLGATIAAEVTSGESAAGIRVWQVAEKVRGVPVVDRSTVWAGTRSHEVLAIRRTDGRLVWRASTGSDSGFGPGDLVRIGDRLIVGDFDLVAMNARDGQTMWRYSSEDGDATGAFLGATSARTVWTGSSSGNIHAVQTDTGRRRWVTRVSTVPAAVFQPVLDRGIVFARYTTTGRIHEGGLVAVEAETGRLLWRQELPVVPTLGSATAGGPLIVGEDVVVVRNDGSLFAFRSATGVLRWKAPPVDVPNSVGQPQQDFRALALVAGRSIVAGSMSGSVIAYTLDGRPSWRSDLAEGSTAFRMGAHGATVYVPFSSGKLVAVDGESGRVMWRIGDGKSEFSSPPAVFENCRYFATSFAGLQAFCVPGP
jgi:outer membrane protein assembly factor BamB